jgi:hypothetical protein
MLEQLLARAEADLDLARRRLEIAQALTADWSYWAPLLNGTAGPVHEAAAAPHNSDEYNRERPLPTEAADTAPQSACRGCGGPVPPRLNYGGRAKVYCSKPCRLRHIGTQQRTGRPRGRPPKAVLDLSPEPLPTLDQLARPFSMHDAELTYIKELLRPPELAVEAPLS